MCLPSNISKYMNIFNIVKRTLQLSVIFSDKDMLNLSSYGVTVPSAPPTEPKCEALSSQSLLVQWRPPPQAQQNGLIHGYRVHYENMDEWPPGTFSYILH